MRGEGRSLSPQGVQIYLPRLMRETPGSNDLHLQLRADPLIRIVNRLRCHPIPRGAEDTWQVLQAEICRVSRRDLAVLSEVSWVGWVSWVKGHLQITCVHVTVCPAWYPETPRHTQCTRSRATKRARDHAHRR